MNIESDGVLIPEWNKRIQELNGLYLQIKYVS